MAWMRLSPKEAAQMLGVSLGKVYALAAPSGPIPCTRIGNPTCKPRKRAKLLESLGKPPFMESMGHAVSLQSGSFLPDGPTNGLKAQCAEGAV